QRGFIWLAHAHRARLKLPPLPHDTSPEDASFLERLDGCWALYQGTGEQRWLDELRDHAPSEFRDSMVANVPMYGAILA
ncbi:MAG: hypothetical protein ACYS0E_20865, partial [Planctomycetota bacterium]